MRAVYTVLHFGLPQGWTAEKLGSHDAEDLEDAIQRVMAPLVVGKTAQACFPLWGGSRWTLRLETKAR